MGSCVPNRDIPLFIDLYRSGRLPVNRLRSGTVALETINEGFDRLARGETVRESWFSRNLRRTQRARLRAIQGLVYGNDSAGLMPAFFWLMPSANLDELVALHR